MKAIRATIVMLFGFTLITGVLYPLAITAAAQIIAPQQANGGLLEVDGKVVGAALIGQNMDNNPRYFWSRPSAINYSPLPSGGSNLGPTSATLQTAVNERAAAFIAANNLADDIALVPSEMLYASASGLDPHISPEAARLQAERVAAARGLDSAKLIDLIASLTEGPQFGFLGQARVNVLLLNLALDKLP
jgi:potassium-transporting ATPase KdpC subunit